MKKAWIENNQVRDIANGNPSELFHPDVAIHFDTDVPDDVERGATWDGSAWINPDPVPPKPITPAMPTLEDYDRALTAHLDAEAQTHRYEDRISCSVRAGYVGPFQAEGIAFAQWMDACNATGYSMLADFQAGNIPQPTIAEMLAALPVMVWP